jgi:hypothetical protein
MPTVIAVRILDSADEIAASGLHPPSTTPPLHDTGYGSLNAVLACQRRPMLQRKSPCRKRGYTRLTAFPIERFAATLSFDLPRRPFATQQIGTDSAELK